VSQVRTVWIGLALAALVVGVATCEVARRAEVRAWEELDDAWQAWVDRRGEADPSGQLTWRVVDESPGQGSRSRLGLEWWGARLVHLYESRETGSPQHIANLYLRAERSWLRTRIEVELRTIGFHGANAPWFAALKSHFVERGIDFGTHQVGGFGN